MELYNRHVESIEYMVALLLDRDMDCLAWIEKRDELEVQRYQWSRLVKSLPYCEGTL